MPMRVEHRKQGEADARQGARAEIGGGDLLPRKQRNPGDAETSRPPSQSGRALAEGDAKPYQIEKRHRRENHSDNSRCDPFLRPIDQRVVNRERERADAECSPVLR